MYLLYVSTTAATISDTFPHTELGQDEAASVTDAGDGVIEKFYRYDH